MPRRYGARAWGAGVMAVAALAASGAALRAQTQLNLQKQGQQVDFSGASFTKPVQTGTSLPSSCEIGRIFFHLGASAGNNLYLCTATDTWTVVASGENSSHFNVTVEPGKLTIEGGTARFGNQVRTSSDATATISGTGTDGTAYIYVAPDGVITIEYPTGATVSCSGCTASGVANPAFQLGVLPMAIVTVTGCATACQWGEVTDMRARMSITALGAGAGVALSDSGGVVTVGLDSSVAAAQDGTNSFSGTNSFAGATTVTGSLVAKDGTLTAPLRAGTSTPSGACTPKEMYLKSDSGVIYLCLDAATWTTVSGGSGSSGADASAYYVVTRSTSAPTNAVNLGALSTGLLKITVAGSVATPSTATGGTDYYAPGGAIASSDLPYPGASAKGAILTTTCTSGQYVTGYDTAGAPVCGTPSSSGSSAGAVVGGAWNATVAASSTRYSYPPYYSPQTSVDGGFVSPLSGTIQSLYLYTSTTQDSTGSLVCTLAVGGTYTSLAVTVAAGATSGVVSDTSHTATVSAGQLIHLRCVNSATAASASIRTYSFLIK